MAGALAFGVKTSLALNTNVHSDRPDNLIRVILDGIGNPDYADFGAMPGFRTSMNDEQIVALVNYMRSSLASDKPSWQNVDQTVVRIRDIVK